MSKKDLYPLKFETIYQRKIWGGTHIHLYKGLSSPYGDIGESWEISPMEGNTSVIANGALRGKDLNTVVAEYGPRLLGEHIIKAFGGEFPLLIKMIDANDDLSVQVHPGDEYAAEHHGSRGKTEMWYLLDTTPDATIYAGWKKCIAPERLKEVVKTDEVMEYLDRHTAKPGDVFYLPAGKVHTIGSGCLILEIQQASDITYRLYDFNRRDSEGKLRDLHIEDAVQVLDYNVNTHSTEAYDTQATDSLTTMASCKYFHTSHLNLTRPFELPVSERDSFTVLFCADGEIVIETDKGNETLSKGETLLLPAEVKECTIAPKGEVGSARIIECFVP